MGMLGGWCKVGRLIQTYCTFFAFFLQLAILIVSGTLLLTPYAKTCWGSLQPTSGINRMWTMHDDFMMSVGLWATQFIWMFIFVFIGLCGAFRGEKNSNDGQIELSTGHENGKNLE